MHMLQFNTLRNCVQTPTRIWLLAGGKAINSWKLRRTTSRATSSRNTHTERERWGSVHREHPSCMAGGKATSSILVFFEGLVGVGQALPLPTCRLSRCYTLKFGRLLCYRTRRCTYSCSVIFFFFFFINEPSV